MRVDDTDESQEYLINNGIEAVEKKYLNLNVEIDKRTKHNLHLVLLKD